MILVGDALAALQTLESESIHCCVTSPPYWGLRDYKEAGQIGLEKSPDEYVEKLVDTFREVRRVLRKDGTLWLNLGDSYAAAGKERTKEQSVRKTTLRGGLATQMGIIKQIPKVGGVLKPKDLVGIPWRVAFALQADGWWLRQDIIWHKPNPMPESVKDRCTKAHEYIFLFAKSRKYYFDSDSIREPYTETRKGEFRPRGSQPFTNAKLGSPVQGNSGGYPQTKSGKNKRSVWTVVPKPFKGAHFATFPPDLIKPCVLAGCPKGGTVLDPFFGAGTTGLVAVQNDRKFVGIELNYDYAEMADERIKAWQSDTSSKRQLELHPE